MKDQCRSCVQCSLKILNSILTVFGVGIISYSLWMLKKWKTHQHTMLYIQELGALPKPWFIYTFLAMGIIVCSITLVGHFAVETANGCTLSIYIFLVLLLVILQGGASCYVLLNKNWEDYIPEDSTGQFNQLKEFIKDNISICKCIGLIAILGQAMTILLAFILRTLGPNPLRNSENDDEYHPFRYDVKQSFLVWRSSLSRGHSESKLILSDVSNLGTHQYGVEEANLPFNHADQSRIPFLNGTQAD